MVLQEGEYLENTTPLKWVLWLEVVVYLGIGVVEFFQVDFAGKPLKAWTKNAWDNFNIKVLKKMHATVCLMLGVIALQGATAGRVSRFELEMLFFTLALLLSVCWTLLPGKLWWLSLLPKPEFWFQIVMWVYCTQYVRWQVLALCAALNAYGILYNVFGFRKTWTPFTYENLRKDLIESEGVDSEIIKKLDKVAGYKSNGLLSG